MYYSVFINGEGKTGDSHHSPTPKSVQTGQNISIPVYGMDNISVQDVVLDDSKMWVLVS